MDYFRSYSPPADAGAVAAWDSQLARAADIPSLAELITGRGADLFPEFARRYAEVRSLPRSARRALRRRLARPGAGTLPPEWRHKLAASAAGAALLIALGQSAAESAVINVGPGCTLAQAMLSAENNASYGGCTAGSGPDTIVLPAKAKITLTTYYDGGSYFGGSGLPIVTTPITITGNGATITRGKGSPEKMSLFLVADAGSLTLENVKLSKGLTSWWGAAVLNYGSLSIADSIITGNVSRSGAVANLGNATINRTTFSKNKAQYGGAIYNRGGNLHLQNSTVSGNSSYLGGGIAIYNGAVLIDPTLISGNKAVFGGGIATVNAVLQVTDSTTIAKNSASYAGGGIFIVDGDVVVEDNSAITGNKAGINGGGVLNCGDFTLQNASITGNSAKVNGGGVAQFVDYHQFDCTPNFVDQGVVAYNKAKYGGNIFNGPGT